MKKPILLEESWLQQLAPEFEKPYFAQLRQFLLQEQSQYPTFPPNHLLFNAFQKCPWDKVKVVILGQDPYHGPGQAHGLCFSVPDGVRFPPSLLNIFKALEIDLGCPIPASGNLERWAEQGVFLLNTTLSVRAHTPLSHQNQGWETFTDAVIQSLSNQKERLVFLLWGSHAQSKEKWIDKSKHLILKSVHPSPLSAHRGFMECKHFSQTNRYLQENQQGVIWWGMVNG